MNVYIMKVKVVDENEGFLEELNKKGIVQVFFQDGGYAMLEDPDWNEIEDMIRSKKT